MMKPGVISFFVFFGMALNLTSQTSKSYLALGDSYTLGESVPIYESFPYQMVRVLREKGVKINAAEIVAKTGWTTDELSSGIKNSILQKKYDYGSKQLLPLQGETKKK